MIFGSQNVEQEILYRQQQYREQQFRELDARYRQIKAQDVPPVKATGRDASTTKAATNAWYERYKAKLKTRRVVGSVVRNQITTDSKPVGRVIPNVRMM